MESFIFLSYVLVIRDRRNDLDIRRISYERVLNRV